MVSFVALIALVAGTMWLSHRVSIWWIIGGFFLLAMVTNDAHAALPPPTDEPMVEEHYTTAAPPELYGVLCATRGEETRCMVVRVPLW